MSRYKKGSFAIPVLLVFLISFILIGGAGLFIYEKLKPGSTALSAFVHNDTKLAEESSNIETKYSTTILYILDVGTRETDKSFMLVRTMPNSSKIICTPLYNNTNCSTPSETNTVSAFYAKGGTLGLKNTLETSLGVTIDNYVKLDEKAFTKLSTTMGGASFNVPIEINDIPTGVQKLSSGQMLEIITYNGYPNESTRGNTSAGVVMAMINNVSGAEFSKEIDNNFNAMIPVVDTDFTILDFKKNKSSLQTLFEDNNDIATIKILPGETSKSETGEFMIADNANEKLKEWYRID